jgi:hypothetical protein
MSEILYTLASAIGASAGGLFKFIGFGTAMLHLKQTYDSNAPFTQKIPAYIAHSLHATASLMAGITLLVAATSAAATFISPLLITLSVTAFVDNLSLLYRDIVEFYHYKSEVKKYAKELNMPDDVLNSKKGFFEYTKFTPEMKKWIKENFESKPENKKLISMLNSVLPKYLDKKLEIENLQASINILNDEISKLKPSRLQRAWDIIKMNVGGSPPPYFGQTETDLQNSIQAMTMQLSDKSNQLMMQKEFLKFNPEMHKIKAEIFVLQEQLRKNYEPYQAFTDTIHQRNLILLKAPMRVANAVMAAAVCALSISIVAAPVTQGVTLALTVSAAAAALIGGIIGGTMFALTQRREASNKAEGEDIFFKSISPETLDKEKQQLYRQAPIFKQGPEYQNKNEEFQVAVLTERNKNVPVEVIKPQPDKQPRSTFDHATSLFQRWRGKSPKSDPEEIVTESKQKLTAPTTRSSKIKKD